MLRTLRSRRRPRYGAHVCAVISALLLLISVSLLYTRLSLSSQSPLHHLHSHQNDIVSNPLVSDSNDDISSSSDDKIDELDVVDEDQENRASNDDVEDDEDQEFDLPKISSSGYFFDHVSGSIRKAFNKRSIEEWDDEFTGFSLGLPVEDRSKAAFGSDDVPLDEALRSKVIEVGGIEEALLLKMGRKNSPLREGWGDWFDKKGDFLRRDRMFKSNLDVLNPMNNPMLQDPDGVGVTGLTRGDKIVQKWWVNEFKRMPFLAKKPLGVSESNSKSKLEENGYKGVVRKSELGKNFVAASHVESRSEIKRAERRTLDDDNASDGSNSKRVISAKEALNSTTSVSLLDTSNKSDAVQGTSNEGLGELMGKKDVDGEDQSSSDYSGNIYADGKRWGYYPGLHPRLSFSNFMDSFFRKGKCEMRVFMVWNSPPWMYSVRHQRGLESLLYHHRDACVVLFSETVELDFFKDSFVKDGYKVAVAMPNLDELLKDTPTHVFASVWFEWRKTKFYSTHYSELVRLAALYKYGGIYLDSDIIVVKPLSLLDNSVGLEDQHAGSSLNGAVMAFRKRSPFIMECLKDFYLRYDDTRLRWNGADLLTRVQKNIYVKQRELKVQPSSVFFPISAQNITRYFMAPASETEKNRQEDLLKKIMRESLTFHFWNSFTSALIPEPQSLVTRLIDYSCIHCSDVM